MHRSSCLPHPIRLSIVALLLLALAGIACAQDAEIAGEYACVEAHVAGRTVACTAAPLNLTGDGKFELEGREGEYLVKGAWVELKGTALKSRARIEAGHRIVFRFYNKRGLCEMVFERRIAELGSTNLS
jgi:hypothetical protein